MTDTMVIAQLCGISMHMSYHTWFYHHIQPNIFENTERNGFRRLPHGRSSQFHPVLGILCTLGVAVATFLSDHAGCGAYVPGGWKLVRWCLGGAQKAYRILCVYIYIYISTCMYIYIYTYTHNTLYMCYLSKCTYIHICIYHRSAKTWEDRDMFWQIESERKAHHTQMRTRVLEYIHLHVGSFIMNM